MRRGDVVAVVETHKGAIDVECFLEGEIAELAPLGVDLPVGAMLAQVWAEAERRGAAAGPAVAPAVPEAPAEPVEPAGPATLGAPAAPAEPAAPAAPRPVPRAKVSPAARRRAAELGLDADALPGSGADAAVTLADVEAADAARAAASTLR